MTFEAEPGRNVAGKYELLRLLGRGAMGEVWLARHNTLGEEVALKILKIDLDAPLETSSWRARFQFEAQVAARLSRKTRNIVQVTDHGEDDGASYLVMERLVGESLGAKLGWRLSMSLAQSIVSQVARGLAHAHREGIIHRDLKPDNIFLTKDEDGNLLVKILDFGIARPSRKDRRASSSSTGYGTVLGTPSYMSPEQSQGLASLDHRADLWALAVVAYEALTSAPPFVGGTLEETIVSICLGRRQLVTEGRPDLGVDVERFFERAFAEKLKDRFQTAEELTGAFEVLIGKEVASTAPDEAPPLSRAAASPTQDAVPRSRRRSIAVAIAVAAAGASIGVGLLVTRHVAPENGPVSSIVIAAPVPLAVVLRAPDPEVEDAAPIAPPPTAPRPIALAPATNKAPRRAPHDEPSKSSAPAPPPPLAPTPHANPSDVF